MPLFGMFSEVSQNTVFYAEVAEASDAHNLPMPMSTLERLTTIKLMAAVCCATKMEAKGDVDSRLQTGTISKRDNDTACTGYC